MSGSETRRASYKKDRYSRYSEIPFSSREIAKTLWIRAADECSNGNQAKLTNTRSNSSPACHTSHQFLLKRPYLQSALLPLPPIADRSTTFDVHHSPCPAKREEP